jgi:hypothetical protein
MTVEWERFAPILFSAAVTVGACHLVASRDLASGIALDMLKSRDNF